MPFLNHWYILLLILIIVLIIYGPGKLPEVGGAIGKAMREFRRATSDLQDEFKKSSSEPNRDSGTPTDQSATDVKSTTDTKA